MVPALVFSQVKKEDTMKTETIEEVVFQKKVTGKPTISPP
jgi:hypothetical protein